jgi:hypothetical protein
MLSNQTVNVTAMNMFVRNKTKYAKTLLVIMADAPFDNRQKTASLWRATAA